MKDFLIKPSVVHPRNRTVIGRSAIPVPADQAYRHQARIDEVETNAGNSEIILLLARKENTRFFGHDLSGSGQ